MLQSGLDPGVPGLGPGPPGSGPGASGPRPGIPDTAWELPNLAQELSDPVQVAPDLVRKFLAWVHCRGRRVVVLARFVWARFVDVGLLSGIVSLSGVGLDLLFGFRGSRVAIWARFVVWASCESGVCRGVAWARFMRAFVGLLSGFDLLFGLGLVGVECMSDRCLGSVFVRVCSTWVGGVWIRVGVSGGEFDWVCSVGFLGVVSGCVVGCLGWAFGC